MNVVCHVLRNDVSYEIQIHKGLFEDPRDLAKLVSSLGNKCALVTDTIVAEIYGRTLEDSLRSLGVAIFLFSFPSGESFKTRQTKETLEDQLLEKGFGRDSVVIAIGGGVVLDVAGFLASTYCRGIPLVMLPTTLLAMVDASIGGKVAVNTPHGKNLIGSFYQPSQVMIDLSVLSTLPLHEYKNGIVEMIKHGLVADQGYFTYLEDHNDELLGRDAEVVRRAVFESCRIKKTIVEQDEKDRGLRHLLNFGHTIGHALEKVTSYSLSHGQAVAIGMVIESYLAVLLGHLSFDCFAKIASLLQKYDLLGEIPEVTFEDLVQAMGLDKKTEKGSPKFVLLEGIGRPLKGDFCVSVKQEVLKEACTNEVLFPFLGKL